MRGHVARVPVGALGPDPLPPLPRRSARRRAGVALTKSGKARGRGAAPVARAGRAGTQAGRWWLALAAILSLTFLVYWPSLDNEFTNWDDNTYVTDNPILVHPDFRTLLLTPISGNHHPLTMASLAWNYAMAGTDPGPYHWTNLLLHLANTALVFFFVRLLSKDRFWTAGATALFFGIHPMHVESVAWIAERKDVLYSFFYLIGLVLYVRYLDTKRWLWLLPVFLAYVLSAASKPAAIVFPLMLLAIDWFRRRKFTPVVWLEKLPFVLVSAAGGYVTLLAQHSVGATAIQWSPFQKVLFASYGTVMYVVKFFLPFRLSAIYPYIHYEGSDALGAEFYVAGVALLVAIPFLVWLCRRSRPVLFGTLFFFINIILVLQIATVGQAVMAERYTYLPYIGLVFAMAWWLDARGDEAAGVPGALRAAIAAVLLLLIPVSAVATWARCEVWRNSETLWNDTIGKYPGKIYDAYTHRGNYYRDVRGNYRAALADFDAAIRLNPGVARGWNFRGMAFAQMGQLDSAAVCFEEAIRLDPQYASALSNRGGVKLSRGDAAGAVVDLTQALERDPRVWGAYTNRALAYSTLGRHDEAAADLRVALQVNPGHRENFVYRNALGLELAAAGRPVEAIAAYDEAIRTTPAGDPRVGAFYLNRARSRAASGDSTGARADVEEARLRGVVPEGAPR